MCAKKAQTWCRASTRRRQSAAANWRTILADVCAFANTAGGAVYVGAKAGKGKIKGLPMPAQTEQEIRTALDDRLTPRLEVKIETLLSQNAKALRIQVPKGADIPYALEGNKFYVRDEAETSLAVRDEIVALVKEALGFEHEGPEPAETSEADGVGEASEATESAPVAESGAQLPAQQERRSSRGGRGRKPASTAQQSPGKTPLDTSAKSRKTVKKIAPADVVDTTFYLPQIGVEIIESEERNGHLYHTIRDLRNGNVIKNVTRQGTRKLWSYALQQHEDKPVDPTSVQWQGNVGLVGVEKRAGKLRYDLALREGDTLRVFYGVTEDGMEGVWAAFVNED